MKHAKHALKKSVKAFKKFHGRAPDKINHVDFSPPKSLIYLGKVKAVEYESDKKLHGTHKPRLFRHKCGSGVSLLAHPNGKWVLIHGGKFRVSDWLRG